MKFSLKLRKNGKGAIMTVKQYDMVEFSAGNAPSVAEFWQGEERVQTESFLKAEGEYVVRFMPHRVGEWR